MQKNSSFFPVLSNSLMKKYVKELRMLVLEYDKIDLNP